MLRAKVRTDYQCPGQDAKLFPHRVNVLLHKGREIWLRGGTGANVLISDRSIVKMLRAGLRFLTHSGTCNWMDAFFSFSK